MRKANNQCDDGKKLIWFLELSMNCYLNSNWQSMADACLRMLYGGVARIDYIKSPVRLPPVYI